MPTASELQARYAAMADEELQRIKRKDLTDIARPYFDAEWVRRFDGIAFPADSNASAPLNPKKTFSALGKGLTAATASISESKRERLELKATKIESAFWLTWKEFVAVHFVLIGMIPLTALLLGNGALTQMGSVGVLIAFYWISFPKRREVEKKITGHEKKQSRRYQHDDVVGLNRLRR
jgi:hypothetical protein